MVIVVSAATAEGARLAQAYLAARAVDELRGLAPAVGSPDSACVAPNP